MLYILSGHTGREIHNTGHFQDFLITIGTQSTGRMASLD